ncbi:MAG: M20/M25/M40 family metallo-hydrolase [Gemmatimonadetes bacterium]|nr:M20/M25/M40 family metallo-hydrolase [Gemmatimonadota bacterium]
MSDYDLPELPSDEELGIAGLSEEDFADDDSPDAIPDSPPADAGASKATPPPSPPPADPAESRAAPPPSGPSGPAWRGPLTLVLLLVATWWMRPVGTMPGTEPANAPDDVFASARAMTELVEIARVPHPPGSPEHARVRGVLLERLRELGLEAEVQTTTYLRRGTPDEARGATVRNLIARVPGSASTGAVVLTAHYDSRAFAPGAGDDATGVVTILETLRALQTAPQLRNDLIVLITDAEELGLLGARAFVESHPWMDEVRLVISVEMRGGGGPSVMFETNTENGWIMERLAAADPHPLANSVSMEVYRRLPNDTDFTPFREAGIQGLNFAAIGRAHVYHQSYDNPENLDERTLQHHGARVLAMTRDLGDADLTTVEAPAHAFVTLPIVGLVSWPVSWSLGFTGALAVLLLVTGAVTWMRGGRLRSLVTGLVLGLVTTGVTAGAGHGLFVWARGRHPEYGSLSGSAFHVEGWYLLALLGLAIAVTTVAFGAVRNRVHRGGVFLGAMLPVAVAAIAAGVAAPEAAANLQGPVAAGLFSVLVVSLAGPKRDGGWAAWSIGLLTAAVVVAFLVVLIELVWLAMSFSLAAGLGILIATTLLLIAPALDALHSPNRWWAPVATVIAAAAFTGAGALTATPSASRPAPSTLLYVQDQGGPGATVEASWVSRPDAGLDWARTATAAALTEERTLEGLELGSGSWTVSDAPALTLPSPRITVTGDTVVDGRRRLSLAVDPGLGAESVFFALESPAGFEAIGDASFADGEGALPVRIWHDGAPQDSVFSLTVVQDATQPALDLEIVQHHQRPWELTGDSPWQRPPDLAPNVRNRSDRAVVRSRLRVLLNGAPGAEEGGEAPVGEPVGALDDGADGAAAGADTLLAPPDTTGGGG